jgi:hypothetical protein
LKNFTAAQAGKAAQSEKKQKRRKKEPHDPMQCRRQKRKSERHLKKEAKRHENDCENQGKASVFVGGSRITRTFCRRVGFDACCGAGADGVCVSGVRKDAQQCIPHSVGTEATFSTSHRGFVPKVQPRVWRDSRKDRAVQRDAKAPDSGVLQ